MLPFGKVKETHLRDFINHWNIDQCEWMGISVNTNLYRNITSNIQMEGLYKGQQNMIQWGQKSKEENYHLSLVKNQKTIKQSKVGANDLETFQSVIAGVLHLHMLRSREHIISWAQNLQISDYKSPVGEEKLLEWVKVSFIVLKKAIENAIKDKESTIQMMLFSGEKEEDFKFKLRIYNLDIEIHETDTLPIITVYDKKNAPDFAPEHQVLKGPMCTLLNPIIDEIIQLLPLIEVLTKRKVIT